MSDSLQDRPQRRTAADPDLEETWGSAPNTSPLDDFRKAFELIENQPYRPDPPPILTAPSAAKYNADLADVYRERLDDLIKAICTLTHTLRPGEVFLEIGEEAWEALKTRAPQAQQIAAGSVQIHDLTGIRILLNPDYGHRWELRHSLSGDVLYEGIEP